MATTDTLSTHPHFVAGTWKLDPAHSEITFSVKHLAISKVRGKFETFDVTIVTAPDDADGINTIDATIDVASVNTNQAQRDGHLRTSDFFLVEEYPTATFHSTGGTWTATTSPSSGTSPCAASPPTARATRRRAPPPRPRSTATTSA